MLVSSRDLVARWKERPATLGLRFYFNEQLGGGSWLIGRVTGSKYAKAEAYLDRGPPPDGIPYIFAGEHELDLGLTMEILNRELGLERLLLEGGGGSNGAFLRAGLIDEVSLAICPVVDGAKGAPTIFDSSDKDAGIAAPIRSMMLTGTEVRRAAWFGSAIGSKTADA